MTKKVMTTTQMSFDPVAAAQRMTELDVEIEQIRERFRLKFRALQERQKGYFEAYPDLTPEQKKEADERYRKAYWELLRLQMAAISRPANEYRRLFNRNLDYQFWQRQQALKRWAEIRQRAEKRKAG